MLLPAQHTMCFRNVFRCESDSHQVHHMGVDFDSCFRPWARLPQWKPALQMVTLWICCEFWILWKCWAILYYGPFQYYFFKHTQAEWNKAAGYICTINLTNTNVQYTINATYDLSSKEWSHPAVPEQIFAVTQKRMGYFQSFLLMSSQIVLLPLVRSLGIKFNICISAKLRVNVYRWNRCTNKIKLNKLI